MRHLLTCFLAVTVFLFIGADFAKGQYSAVTIPGFKIKIVGCYKENTAKRNIPTILFSDARGTNSKTKIDYKNFGNYIKDAVTRCAKMTNTRSFSFFAMQKIGDCYSGKVSATYARSGSATNCKNFAGAKCNNKQDCVGGDDKSNFVYKLERLPTTPTKKPTTKATTKKPGGSTAATKQPTAGTAAKLNALTCQNYVVAIKTSSAGSAGKPAIPTPSKKPTAKGKSTGPTAATPTTPSTTTGQSAIEAKVKNIYKGYTCLVCLRTVNASSSTVYLMLQFSCQGQHLKKLVAGIGASNIVKAECYPPACTTTMSPCPLPCGMATCPMSPTLAYPSICPATVPAPAPLPAPVPPPQCPGTCPSMCAPACNSFCCRSMIRHKSITEQSAKKSSTNQADDFDDDDDYDEDDDDDEENDDTDIDETN